MATLKQNPIGGTSITDLVVEQQDTMLTFPESVHVLENFDPAKAIGTAKLKKTEDGIVADIDLYNHGDFSAHYPAIGFKVTKQQWKNEERTILEGQIMGLSLSTKPNVDSAIKCIADQLDK